MITGLQLSWLYVLADFVWSTPCIIAKYSTILTKKMHTISILFTVIFLKTLNCYGFRTILVDHNGGYCELNDSCVQFCLKL
jgi:hypothetical protein